MKKQNITVSPFFVNLHDLYLDQLQQLSRNSQGEEDQKILHRSLDEQRSQASEYFAHMNEHPEFAAPLFHGMIEFWAGTPNEIIERLVNSDETELPRLANIITEVVFHADIRPLLHMSHSMHGGEKFLVTIIGLEYLRVTDWTAVHITIPTEDSDGSSNEEDEWKQDEAPQFIGLDEPIMAD